MIVFVVMASGYRVRCGLEEHDSGKLRFNRLKKIVGGCSIGIHDLSRTQLTGSSRMPRFNMPFELGLYMGAKYFGGAKHSHKATLVLARNRREFLPSISDLAGADIGYHSDDELSAVRSIREFLHETPSGRLLPGEENLLAQFRDFMKELPRFATGLQLTKRESLQFRNFVHIVDWYLIGTKKGRGRSR